MIVELDSSLNAPNGGWTRSQPAAGVREQLARLTAKRWVWLLGAIVPLLIAIATFAWRGGGDADSAYTTAVVARGDIEDSVTALGNLQPRDYVDVGAQATGQLKKLYVDIGYTVKQGQLLAEMDPQVANAKVGEDQGNLANLKAQLADKQARLLLANANFARQRGLKATDATSKSDYDSAAQAAGSAAAEVNALRGQIAAAQSQLDGDQVTLGYTKIHAPMSGTAVSVSIKQGQTINSVQQAPTILRIANLKTMTVWTQVSEADVPKLKIGMPAFFTTLGNPDKRWYGRLQQIQPTPTITNNVVLYTATFDVANPSDELMTQMTTQVFFVTASAHDVVTVPVSALHKGRGRAGGRTGSGSPKLGQGLAAHPSGWNEAPRENFAAVRTALGTPGAKRYFVLIVKPNGSIEQRSVAVGVTNRVSAQVLAGLSIGEQVVVGLQLANMPARDRANSARNGRSGYNGRPHLGGFP